MRGSRAKKLRRAAYGPDSGGKDHRERGYTILKTYQKIVPLIVRADKDDGSEEDQRNSVHMPGKDGHTYHYRYEPWLYHGQHVADLERRKYLSFKYWWKAKKILSGRLNK
jgi:hypothetical protein